MKSLSKIRSIAIARANSLQRCHSYLEELNPAFADWIAGEVYVCKKTGTYRYRFGERSKSVAPWDSLVREIFPAPAAFAFAAMVLGERDAERISVVQIGASEERADVISLAEVA